MKLIEALKLRKSLKRKLDDIETKLKTYCADRDYDTPVYQDQSKQMREWLQSHEDIVKEIGRLNYAIRSTNIKTKVTIELGGVHVTNSICWWVDRRKEGASLDEKGWRQLSDKGIPEVQKYKLTASGPESAIKLRLYFDPAERDRKIELYRSEPSKIDATLETVNAVTDLLDY